MTFLLTIAEADEKMTRAGWLSRQSGRESADDVYTAMLSARPSICDEIDKARREVIEAGNELFRDCYETQSQIAEWMRAHGHENAPIVKLKDALSRLRSLEENLPK
jgi:hypothetical protein